MKHFVVMKPNHVTKSKKNTQERSSMRIVIGELSIFLLAVSIVAALDLILKGKMFLQSILEVSSIYVLISDVIIRDM